MTWSNLGSEKLWMYKIKNRWVIGTAPGWNECLVHSTKLNGDQRPTDPSLQWYNTGEMKQIEIAFSEAKPETPIKA